MVFLLAVFQSLSCFTTNENCFSGIVVGKERCSNSILMRVTNPFNLGRDIIFYDGNEFSNVIRVPGSYPAGKITFRTREFNEANDEQIFSPFDPCSAVYAPFDVPLLLSLTFATNCTRRLLETDLPSQTQIPNFNPCLIALSYLFLSNRYRYGDLCAPPVFLSFKRFNNPKLNIFF